MLTVTTESLAFLLSSRVVKMRSTTSCRNTVRAILYPEKLDNIDSIR